MGHPVENLHDIKLSHPCNKNWNETFNIFFFIISYTNISFREFCLARLFNKDRK